MSATTRRAGLTLLLVAAGGAGAEEPAPAPTPAQLVARNLEARGGAARWKEIRTLELRGKFDAWSAPVDMTIQRFREGAYRFDHMLFGAPITLASDGTTPWLAAVALGAPEAQPLDEAWKRNIVEDSGFISRLQQLAEAGAPMEVVGRGQVDGTPAWQLRLAPADAPPETWHLDAATGLELKRESTTFDVFSGAIEMPMETYYMDFRVVEGLKFPFREERHFGTRYQLFVVSVVRVNPPIDKSRFTAPARKKDADPPPEDVGRTGDVAACPVCGAPEATGVLGDAALVEVSGVVASLAHPGVFWVHNDSGDVARFFAVDTGGKRLATISVANAKAVDWEDIARGPCPAGTCLYLADFGDNRMSRASYTLYRLAEPATVADATVTPERLDFTYPDGAHNAEALLVHPITGAVTIVTKAFVGGSSIYEMPAPLTPGAVAVLKVAGSVKAASGLFTGGSVHPSGKGVLLRTYSEVWYYPMASGDSVAAALAGTPCPMPAAGESQGEAVGWLVDGAGYVTISEGASAKVNRVACGGF